MTTILSADIGGTKTIIELSQYAEGSLHSIRKQTSDSAIYNCFSNALAGFLNPSDSIDIACFGIAGPIHEKKNKQTANVTNLPWVLDSQDLEETFKIPKIYFINDFQAMGYAIEHLSVDDVEVLQQGQIKDKTVRAVIGAGTGLGEAILAYNGKKYDVLATEGGHLDFAATNSIEFSLFEYINKAFSHVSYERILSGTGLITIFKFLCQTHLVENEDKVKEILASTDPAAAISIAANEKTDPLAEQALSLFMKIYGAKAGNLALNCLPKSGLYICGGIAAKNRSFLKNSHFMTSFNAKGRMQELMEQIPVKLVTNQEAGLLGATQYALSMSRL